MIDVVEEVAGDRHGVGRDVLLALGSFAVGESLAVWCDVTHLRPLGSVALHSVDEVLCVEHRQQYIGEVLTAYLRTHQSESFVDASHGDLGHSFEYVIHALGLTHRGTHEGLVNHHTAEASVVLLLQYEHDLSHIEVIRISEVEGILPTGITLKHGHELLDARIEGVHRCRSLHDDVAEPLDEMVDVHLQRVAAGVQYFCHFWIYLASDLFKAVFFIFLVAIDFLISFDVSQCLSHPAQSWVCHLVFW